MGRFLLKPKADEDFYVNWSTNTDAPVYWGTRADLVPYAIENNWITEFERRLALADETGCTYGIRAHTFDAGPDRTIIYQAFGAKPGMWEVKVEELRALIETYEPDEDGDLIDSEASARFYHRGDWDDED
jgi:hypothetical protein